MMKHMRNCNMVECYVMVTLPKEEVIANGSYPDIHYNVSACRYEHMIYYLNHWWYYIDGGIGPCDKHHAYRYVKRWVRR